MPLGRFSIVSSPVFGPPAATCSPLILSRLSAAQRQERGRSGTFFAPTGGHRRQLEYGNNVCVSEPVRRSKGWQHNDRSKPDLLPSSDAATAAFCRLGSSEMASLWLSGPGAKREGFLALSTPPPFFFPFSAGAHRSPVSVTPF